jgi:ferrochelatase
MTDCKKIGIVLFQLGGPDSLEAVEPFLYNLFCDPDIIPIPVVGGLLRKPLARYISRQRSKYVAEHYREIGGRSPLGLLTARQARALENVLRAEFDPRIFIAMRYWHPLTEETAALARAEKFDRLILLPLYPHFSYATTLSSLKEWNRCYIKDSVPVRTIGDFHTHPLYIEAIVARIETTFRHFQSRDGVHIVFSAHGLPLSLIQKGDPYQQQIQATVKAVLERGGWPHPHTLCYQSRVGPQKWLEPSLTATIFQLAAAKVKRLLVVPVSFVTEHIETLFEINIEARETAQHAGIEQFRMMPAVGDSPKFIACLADLVRGAVASAK